VKIIKEHTAGRVILLLISQGLVRDALIIEAIIPEYNGDNDIYVMKMT